MIEINLLPEELKKAKQELSLPTKQIGYIIVAGIGLLIIIHLYFIFAIPFKYFQYKFLNKTWLANRSSIDKVEAWKKEHDLVNQDTQDIKKLTQARILLADKLKIMNKVLPDGVWFNNLSIKGKDFLLQGSAVSIKGDHMSIVRLFLEQLKNDKVFFSDFMRLELGPVKMREFKGYQIMDFILEGNLK